MESVLVSVGLRVRTTQSAKRAQMARSRVKLGQLSAQIVPSILGPCQEVVGALVMPDILGMRSELALAAQQAPIRLLCLTNPAPDVQRVLHQVLLPYP